MGVGTGEECAGWSGDGRETCVFGDGLSLATGWFKHVVKMLSALATHTFCKMYAAAAQAFSSPGPPGPRPPGAARHAH